MCVKSYPAWPFPHLQARSAEFGAPDQTVAAKSPASVCGLLSARAAPHAAPASAGPPAPTHTHTRAHTEHNRKCYSISINRINSSLDRVTLIEF